MRRILKLQNCERVRRVERNSEENGHRLIFFCIFIIPEVNNFLLSGEKSGTQTLFVLGYVFVPSSEKTNIYVCFFLAANQNDQNAFDNIKFIEWKGKQIVFGKEKNVNRIWTYLQYFFPGK